MTEMTCVFPHLAIDEQVPPAGHAQPVLGTGQREPEDACVVRYLDSLRERQRDLLPRVKGHDVLGALRSTHDRIVVTTR